MCHSLENKPKLRIKKTKLESPISISIQMPSSLKINKDHFYDEFSMNLHLAKTGSVGMRVPLPIKSSLEINWNECRRIFAAHACTIDFNFMRITIG